jgi:HD-GYP domain-containing protein (c-di-GMP phosphodiesterase class II)
VLRKPGPLTPEEWEVVKRHPVVGEEILKPVRRLAGVARLVRHHQERWDGTGYPDGLRGQQIPLGARILAVVDAYTAITDHRPYRPARTHEEAVTELRRCAGSQLDPAVVSAFLQVLEADRGLLPSGDAGGLPQG